MSAFELHIYAPSIGHMCQYNDVKLQQDEEPDQADTGKGNDAILYR